VGAWVLYGRLRELDWSDLVQTVLFMARHGHIYSEFVSGLGRELIGIG
jgi:hypothetical protein